MVAKTYGGSPLIRRKSIRHVTAAPAGRPTGPRRPRPYRDGGGGLGHHLERVGPGAHRPGGPGRGHRARASPSASATVSPTGPPQVTSTPWADQPGHRSGVDLPHVDGRPRGPGQGHRLGAAAAHPHRDPGAGHRRGHRGQAAPADRGRLEGDPVGLVLLAAQPVTGADAGDQPAAAQGVHAAQHLDQHVVGQQADPGHQGAEGDGRGRRRPAHRAGGRTTGPAGRAGPSATGGRSRRPRRSRAPRPGGRRPGRCRPRRGTAAG